MLSQLPPLHSGSASSSPAASPSRHHPPVFSPNHPHTSSSLYGSGLSLFIPDDREVLSSNMSARLRHLLDVVQAPPPPPLHAMTTPAKDANQPPSPKPLFGTRPPPAALRGGFNAARDRESMDGMGSGTGGGGGGGGVQSVRDLNRPSSPSTPSRNEGYSFESPFSSGSAARPRREGPLCSGWLSMQKNPGKWQRFWCEYSSEGVLSYRVDDTTKKPVGSIQVVYCEAELTQLPASQLNPLRKGRGSNTDTAASAVNQLADGVGRLDINRSSSPVGSSSSSLPVIQSPTSAIPASSSSSSSSSSVSASSLNIPSHMLAAPPSLPLSKSSEAYWRYLEDEEEDPALWCFKVLSPNRLVLFKADIPGSTDALRAASESSNPNASMCGEELRNNFVLTIRNHLQQMFGGTATTSASAGGNHASSGSIPSLPRLDFDSPPRKSSPSPPPAAAASSSSSSSSQQSSPAPPSQPSAGALLWKQKHDAMTELTPILHEQFMLQIERFKTLQQALAKDGKGFNEDDLPITSIRKEKSGVLCMEQQQVDKEGKGNSSSSNYLLSSPASSSSSSSSSSSALSAETPNWRDYYFVLFEGCLFYYADSKSTTPTGFITLRYGSLIVDPKRLSRGEYVFHVQTPLRTICCKTKHPVALSEWISVLEHTLTQHAKKNNQQLGAGIGGAMWQAPINGSPLSQRGEGSGGAGGNMGHRSSSTGSLGGGGGGNHGGSSSPNARHGLSLDFSSVGSGSSGSGSGGLSGSASMGALSDRKSSMVVLQNINKWINAEILSSATNTFQDVIRHPEGLEYFRRALREEEGGVAKVGTAHAHLDFYLATQEYINLFTSPTPPSPSDVSLLATQIFTRFLTPSNPTDFLSESSEDQRGMIEDQLPSPAPSTFDAVRAISISILTAEFADFKRTSEYAVLSELLQKAAPLVEDKREIAPLDPLAVQLFKVKVKGSKESREVQLDKKKNVLTIGRDKSNMLVIEDSRVSRSHARVEFSETQCEYIDLGSSCGSKLNGKPVLRARLRPGDVIELGQSVLIFMIRKKKGMIAAFLARNEGSKRRAQR